MQAGWKSRSQYMKTRAFSALRQVSDKYHPFLIELPHPTSIQTLLSVCLAQLYLQLYFSRNKITISAWKSKQIFFFSLKELHWHSQPIVQPQCQPSGNEAGGGISSHKGGISGCWKQCAAADPNQVGGSCCFSSHQEQSQGFPAPWDQAPELGNFHCEGELELGPKAMVCWQMRHVELPGDTALQGGQTQGSGDPAAVFCLNLYTSKPAPSGWAEIT